MGTSRTGLTSFWHKLKRGPWGKPVADRIAGALDDIVRRLRVGDAVVAVMVFGSYARGEFGRKSDLDLLVLLYPRTDQERSEAEKGVVRTVVEVETEARLPVHIAPLVADARHPDALGQSLLHEIWTDGIILYAEAAVLAELQPSGLAPWNVVRFSLHGVAPRERVRLARRLHGQRERPGIIRLPGVDLARGAAFVPAEQSRAVRDALDEAGATYDIIPVWREV